jgi:hypothetical protein
MIENVINKAMMCIKWVKFSPAVNQRLLKNVSENISMKNGFIYHSQNDKVIGIVLVIKLVTRMNNYEKGW